MKQHFGLFLAVAMITAGCAAETEPAPQLAERENLVTRRAVVETVDVEGRQVLLRGEGGRMLTVEAGPEVRNLAQLEPGDVVKLELYEAVAVKMADPSKPGDPMAVAVAERAIEGAKPGAAAGEAVNLVVSFISYDPATSVSTFALPDGRVETVVVRPEMREFAAARQPGDRIDLTIIRAVAISIEETAG